MMYENMLGFGIIEMMFTGFMLLGLIVLAAIYVYFALVMQTIAKKLKHPKPWLAWIPFANIAQVLQLGNFHWAWTFLILIPILGLVAVWVLTTISFWRIFERRKYPGWLALVQWGGIIPFINFLSAPAFTVILGLVAWKDQK